jgi:hypothetical protein
MIVYFQNDQILFQEQERHHIEKSNASIKIYP